MEAAWALARQSLSESILHASLSSQLLPEEDDFHFYANFPVFSAPVKSLRARLRALLQALGGQEFPEDVEDSFDWLSRTVDVLLEQVDVSLEATARPETGASGSSQTELGSGRGGAALLSTSSPLATPHGGRVVVKHAASVDKPQEAFDDPPDNSNDPRALSPDRLQPWGGTASAAADVCVFAQWQQGAHPPQPPLPLDETPFELVEDLEQLRAMASLLEASREIAVDLENHSYRSFQGFVCLMQISTRTHDFVVDALALRSHIGPILGPLFADPSRVKVLHGADHDILWLQRDFSIHVRNMFDTGQAARVLGLPRFGLAFLLSHFCNVQSDKRYQLADWRIRPLPEDMIQYAREDTHYLLYCYDKLKEELMDDRPSSSEPSALLLEVMGRSRDLCLQRYRKSKFTSTDYLDFYRSQKKQLEEQQLAVLSEVFKWRDETARQEDESTAYVLPNHLLIRIAEAMPSSVRELGATLRGAAPVAARSAAAIVDLIVRAKEESAQPPVPPAGAIGGADAPSTAPGPPIIGSNPRPSPERNSECTQQASAPEECPAGPADAGPPSSGLTAAEPQPRRPAGQLARPRKRPRLGLGAMLGHATMAPPVANGAGERADHLTRQIQALLLLPKGLQQPQKVEGQEPAHESSSSQGDAGTAGEPPPAVVSSNQPAAAAPGPGHTEHAEAVQTGASRVASGGTKASVSSLAKAVAGGGEDASYKTAVLHDTSCQPRSLGRSREGSIPQSLRESHKVGSSAGVSKQPAAAPRHQLDSMSVGGSEASPAPPAGSTGDELTDGSNGSAPGLSTEPVQSAGLQQGEAGPEVGPSRPSCVTPGLLPAYDYEAARAALKLTPGRSSIRTGATVRGGSAAKPRSGGKQGGRKPDIGGPEQTLGPWIFDPLTSNPSDKEGLKAGKRSQVYPRSGNRSVTFRN